MKVPAVVEDETPERAQQIYQEMLDRIGAAYFAGDWDYFHHVIAVPHTFVTFEGTYEITDVAGLERLFNTFRNFVKENDVTSYARICEAAMFRGPEAIEGMHMTHILRHGELVSEPFPSKSVLRVIEGYWRVCASDNALEGTDLFPMALRTAGLAPVEGVTS